MLFYNITQKEMNHSQHSSPFIRLIAALLFLPLACTSGLTQAAPQTLRDITGRDIYLKTTPKRIVLCLYYEDFIAVGGEQALDKVVGISRDAWAGWKPANWALYTRYRPAIQNITDVGEIEAHTFSVEKILALNPDVVIMAEWQYKAVGGDIKRLEKAGIPVTVIDFHAETPERHVASIRLLGQLTGQYDRANRIARDYQAAIEQVHTRLAKANLPKPRVYIEFGNKGPAEYSFTYGKSMWGALVNLAGGNNIAEPIVASWGPINPEYVLTSKPDTIFITGTESSSIPTAMVMGNNVDSTTAKTRLQGFVARKGWDNLPAVTSRRVYGLYHGTVRTISDYTMVQYIAKALYPALFKDIDPQANYQAFYQRYLPVTPSGTFMQPL